MLYLQDRSYGLSTTFTSFQNKFYVITIIKELLIKVNYLFFKVTIVTPLSPSPYTPNLKDFVCALCFKIS